MFGQKLKLEKELLDRAEKAAEAAGYSSVSEFITHIVERELQQLEGASSEEDLKNRLKGLGYIS
jgi:metal-responsive CopG/Arc/MetJ family transcriptional regulator